MDSLATHPQNAQQAKSFIAPGSLSFPGGAGELTPPSSEKDGQTMNGGSGANGQMNGQPQGATSSQPAGSAGTAAVGTGASGIVPTLQ